MLDTVKNWFRKHEPVKLEHITLKGKVFDVAAAYVDDDEWDVSVLQRRKFWRWIHKNHPEIESTANRVFVHGSQIYIVRIPNDIDSDDIFSKLVDGNREFYV